LREACGQGALRSFRIPNAQTYLIVDIYGTKKTARYSWTMSDHVILGAMLIFSMILTTFVGYFAWRAFRLSQQIEGLTAATYLEARRALTQHRP
jgi:hypothetical protein